MAIYNTIHEAADYINRHCATFQEHRIATGCANVRIFDTLMRTFDRMNPSDIDCGVSFSATAWMDGKCHDLVVTLYKEPDGKVRLQEHVIQA